MRRLRARLNRPEAFEYVLLGSLLLVLGAFSQLGWIGGVP